VPTPDIRCHGAVRLVDDVAIVAENMVPGRVDIAQQFRRQIAGKLVFIENAGFPVCVNHDVDDKIAPDRRIYT